MRSRGVGWALTRQDEDETRTDRQDGHVTTEAEAAAPTCQGAPAATRAGSSKKWPFPCGFRREPGPAGPSMWDLRPRELGESGLLLCKPPVYGLPLWRPQGTNSQELGKKKPAREMQAAVWAAGGGLSMRPRGRDLLESGVPPGTCQSRPFPVLSFI